MPKKPQANFLQQKILMLLWSAPFERLDALESCHACQQWLEQGHQVTLFGYNNGVFHFAPRVLTPPEQISVVEYWQSLKQQYPQQLDCAVCLTACLKRGLASYTDNQLYPSVRVSGLGELVELLLEADRIVEVL